MSVSDELQRIEQIIDTAQISRGIELLLPVGVRPRQLKARTLLLGMLLTAVHGRPSHLRRVHRELLALPDTDQHRLGIITQWRDGPHLLSYRQLERTFGLIQRALSKHTPDGTPSQLLSETLDALLEASVTVLGTPLSTSYAVDWTDLEAWSSPPRKPRATSPDSEQDDHDHRSDGDGDGDGDGEDGDDRGRRDREAAWGHRNTNHPAKSKMFYGYYLQAITSVPDEHGPPVPELARRMHLGSCDHDPPAQIVPVINSMKASGVQITDLLADSGYSYRIPETWALPLRALKVSLVVDLHPQDRGTNGTHMGAICHNGNLYCPATPKPLLEHSSPLPRGSSAEQTLAHDHTTAELERYKLSPISAYDPDGYRRVKCPAAQSKLRCPLRPASLTLPHNRPTILEPPSQPPVCCQQQTITVPPSVNAKTAQKHDYPSPAHRASYNRRTAAERTFATITDPATND